MMTAYIAFDVAKQLVELVANAYKQIGYKIHLVNPRKRPLKVIDAKMFHESDVVIAVLKQSVFDTDNEAIILSMLLVALQKGYRGRLIMYDRKGKMVFSQINMNVLTELIPELPSLSTEILDQRFHDVKLIGEGDGDEDELNFNIAN